MEKPKKNTKSELKKVELTMQEIWAASKPIVHKNKKKYTRKGKNTNQDEEKI